MTKTLTVVYAINDENAFKAERNKIFDKFVQGDGLPWSVSAVSINDEIHRLGLIEEAHSEGRHDLFDTIFSMAASEKIKQLSDIEGY